MRGARALTTTSDGNVGIIPAYAGSTLGSLTGTGSRGDHPRVCGEHPHRLTQRKCSRGSSPRMRGAPAGAEGEGEREGIIPAYAGSTTSGPTSRGRPRDHPRVCGEHQRILLIVGSVQGSSPRMRGAHGVARRGDPARGIIPAYAGSTARASAARRAERDHPRVCGEHPQQVTDLSRHLGSSPRMRGARLGHAGAVADAGIIPAYAGSTSWSWRPRRRCWDHPRVCGEHLRRKLAKAEFLGSSPRMRGARG